MWSISDSIPENPIVSWFMKILIYIGQIIKILTFGLISNAFGELENLVHKGIFKFILDMYRDSEEKLYQRFRLGHVPVVVVFNANISRKILTSNVSRGLFYTRLRTFFGDGIFTSWNKNLWRNQRNNIFRIFSTKNLKEITPALTISMFKELDQIINENNSQDLVSILSRIGLVGFCEVIFGVNVVEDSLELIEPLNNLLTYINGAAEPIDIKFGKKYAEFIKNKIIVHNWMRKLITKAKENPKCHPTIKDEINNNNLTEQQIIEYVLSIVLGGHETTARLILGIIYSVYHNPDIIKKMNEETSQYLQMNKEYNYNILNLPYLQSVIKEGTRLYPPVWILNREAKSDIEVDKNIFKKGTQFLISPLIYLRDPKIWGSNSEKFIPERFTQITPEQKINFIPFILGDEDCPGRIFAQLESSIIVSKLFNEYDLLILPHKLNPMSAGTFRLTDNLPVIIKKK
ncbi:cytochrome P450 family protein [Acanthamoeba polyphaga moumouvirus]|uniref:Cytochrome P450 family protein n=1 Tax=Acanthamoeba polyphaga moumouvirus TaxID=1269028 RepID=L7RCT3_9VIRU|nr:cytochrome P450 family protein [Acanthamoeba polyphaga moumouvirus]AGC02097.1 cytochrome P450 family protein [Acanthamoeba polyphaga moumouvirus]AQN68469.1 cytochrome P450 family protein [Saudi moumouvirus]